MAPNPMVGAVLVHDGRIIGEGYHHHYGEAHAEVHCIRSVPEKDRSLISKSILYVSLEPCAHYGKTPPCTDLIIEKKIPRVVIGCRDPFIEVDGKGIEKLNAAGVEVLVGVLETECKAINKRFITNHTKRRPYIILKWAETADGKIAAADSSRIFISNLYSNRIVHKWRSQESSVLIGTNTALCDNPSLNLRYWEGTNPLRLIIDKNLRLPSSLKIFDHTQPTIIFNYLKQESNKNLIYCKLNENEELINNIIDNLYELKIQSVIVEGGNQLLQSFIDSGQWDEARVIVNQEMSIGLGISAPELKQAEIIDREELASDTISYFAFKA